MKTLIIDSNFLCHRAAYVTGELEYHGAATGIAYGFFNQLFNTIKLMPEAPDRLIFFWDSRKNLRKEILPVYKNKRKLERSEEEQKLWKDIYLQFSIIRKKILPAIKFNNNFMQPGYESDDLIAKYCHTSIDSEQIYIATSDDDLLQLLTDTCSILNLNRKEIYTKAAFINDKKIKPSQWPLVKQIAGCSSDNVPGINGVGEKTAIKYIRKQLKENTKAFQKIQENTELINFNKQLVLLPFKQTIDIRSKIIDNTFSMKRFLRMCRDYGFSSFRNEKRKEEIRELFKNI